MSPVAERRQTPTSGEADPPIKTGLRRKFLSAILLLIGGMSAVFFLFFYFEAKKLLTSEFEKRSFVLINTLARNLEPYLAGMQREEMKSIVDNLLEIRDVLYVWVQSSSGETRFQRMAKPITPPTLSEEEQARQNEWKRTWQSPEAGTVWEFILPIYAGRRPATSLMTADHLRQGLTDEEIRQLLAPNPVGMNRIAVMGMGMTAHSIEQELRSKSLVLGGFILVFLLTGAGVSLFLSRIIVDPIQRLARAMKLVAVEETEAGQDPAIPSGRRFRRLTDLNIQVQSHDEIEQLADEFLIMVRKLERSYENLETIISDKSRMAQEKTELAENLKAVNRKNEAVIKERTREVVEKNLRLYEISEELQLQKEDLISMNEQLEKTSRMKSEFLASMSHELRTPLNSIIGFAEVLKEKMFGELNERQEKYLSNILASGRHLLQLINNILDISKVEAGKMKLTVEAYSLNRVIDEVQNIIRTLAYKKNIELTLNVGPDQVMHGDVSKFKQILYNLLSNAIKFTDEHGAVILSTRELEPGAQVDEIPDSGGVRITQPSILLCVKDTGIGIKPEDLPRIFIEFEQTDQTRRRRYEGTGLGLALTKKLIELHTGHIWVKSEVGRGTTVMVVLPVAAPPDEDNEKEC